MSIAKLSRFIAGNVDELIRAHTTNGSEGDRKRARVALAESIEQLADAITLDAVEAAGQDYEDEDEEEGDDDE